MLYPEMRPMDPIPSGGGAPRPKPEPDKPNVPLVVFTAFDAQTAEALSERLQNTVRPADRAAEVENDPPSPIQTPAQPDEPRIPVLAPEFEEPEFSAFELENAWSSEVPFINLDAAEMSYYFSALEDDLVREVSISLQHQKFILFHLDDPLEYLKSFATYTWYEESDEAAEEFIQWYVDRFRTELEEQREREWSREVESDLEYWIKYVANDERETIIVYDLDARETLFVRYGDKHSVTMQELHQKLAEGRNIFVIHNHPNNTGASLADLSAVAWLDAEYFVVVNPDGTLHFHKRIGDAMVALEPVHNPDIVAPADPFETAVAELAYLFQTWSEMGNPPEMVMRQRELLWWEQGNIIVPYHTDETYAEVASRMIGPPPNEELSEGLYDQASKSHRRELQDFTAYLSELNPEYEGSDIMSIPLPGWTIEAGSFSFGTRTLFRSMDKTSPEQWWEELTPVEQKIEMALTATANARKGIANLDNLYPLDLILNWVEKNGELIDKYAIAARIPPGILKANLAPEFLYDYSWSSHLQDTLVRDRDWVFDHPRAWSSTGVSNVHFATLSEAYNYIAVRLPEGAEHPWNSDPNAPDLSSFPDITATQDEVEAYAKLFYEQDGRWPQEGFKGLELHQQDTMRFLASEANYHRLTFDQQYAVARYLATDEGAINAASIVVGMYLDRYIAFNWEDATNFRAIAEALSPEDVARIWGRYRSTFEPYAYEELGPNAHLALPLAEYFLDQD